MNFNGNKIEAIIFDLGGVIVNIDIEGGFRNFQSIGIGLEEHPLHIIKNNDVFLRYELGQISTEDFREELKKISNQKFEDIEFDEVWNSIIRDFPLANIRFLEDLKTKCRTFLMSNTNQLHVDSCAHKLKENFGYEGLDDLFEKVYYSHTSGMRKPNQDFFEHILHENGLIAGQTLFVDDFIENIETAKHLGINTFHITNGRKILDLSFS
jgi:glucose-1-phosphatase